MSKQFYELKYFKKSDNGICADDFKNIMKTDIINLFLISSISELKSFCLPFSGKLVDKYVLVTMNNGDKYYISEYYSIDLLVEINHYK
jgi:hypothetical protein